MSLLAGIEQDSSGAILSSVVRNGNATPDLNVFTTALFVRALRRQGLMNDHRTQYEFALDYLEDSEAPDCPGAYGFWRDEHGPEWAPQLPPDLDDTAIVLLELVAAGRRSRAEVQAAFYRHLPLVLFRPAPEEIVAPWLRGGAYGTWIVRDRKVPNIVDCCVNANAVALLAYLGCKSAPGYANACAAIEHAVDWSRHSGVRRDTLSPFYCTAFELFDAVDHAVECGASELARAARLLRPASMPSPAEPTPLYRSAYGKTQWFAHGLSTIRQSRPRASLRGGREHRLARAAH